MPRSLEFPRFSTASFCLPCTVLATCFKPSGGYSSFMDLKKIEEGMSNVEKANRVRLQRLLTSLPSSLYRLHLYFVTRLTFILKARKRCTVLLIIVVCLYLQLRGQLGSL